MPVPNKADDFITATEAAAIAERSTGWVRDQAMSGRVDCVRGDRLLVSRRDILRLVRRRRPKPRLPVPYLRLVVDNT